MLALQSRSSSVCSLNCQDVLWLMIFAISNPTPVIKNNTEMHCVKVSLPCQYNAVFLWCYYLTTVQIRRSYHLFQSLLLLLPQQCHYVWSPGDREADPNLTQLRRWSKWLSHVNTNKGNHLLPWMAGPLSVIYGRKIQILNTSIPSRDWVGENRYHEQKQINCLQGSKKNSHWIK